MGNYKKIAAPAESRVELHDALGLTGAEVSINRMAAGTQVPFVHSHKQNEEVYLVLRGSGDFQVDGTAFPIAEGSIVRVATHCNRSLRCTSAQGMLYLCIQVKEGSLEQCTLNDGVITQQEVAWK